MKYLLQFITILLSTGLVAQVDTSLLLSTIEVHAQPINKATAGTKVEQWDSLQLVNYQTQSVGDWLERETGVFVKNYGAGTLSTTSMRGGSAGHTLVLWNGLPLQSPMLGLLDISLIPMGLMDGASLNYGGNSTAWGSGAVGGVIELHNKPYRYKGWGVEGETKIASFGRYNQNLAVNYHKNNWSTSTRLVYLSAQNNFTYQVAPSLPLREQKHAGQLQYAVLQNVTWQMRPNQSLSLLAWWQQNDKEIPPTTTQDQSLASQKDKALRTSLQWKRQTQKNEQNINIGWMDETIDYRNDLTLTQALSGFTSLLANAQNKWTINEASTLLVGANYMHTDAFSNGYKTGAKTDQLGAFVRFTQALRHWRWELGIRQEMMDAKWSPFIPSAGLDWYINNYITVNAKVSRNFRVPTLNDRFWKPGGNPDLKPENGWAQEVGATINKNIKQLKLSYSVTGFNRNITDWIMWAPHPIDNYWTAQNITEVWSRGIEQKLTMIYQYDQWTITNMWRLDWVKSTSQVSLDLPKIQAGEQIYYVPIYRASAYLTAQYKDFQLGYTQQYTSQTEGVKGFNSAYTIGHINASYTQKVGQINARLYGAINNVWNTNYRIIEQRGMPRRAYEIGLKWQF